MQGRILTRVATLTVDANSDGLLGAVNDTAVVDVRDMHSISLFVNHVDDDPAQTNGTKAELDLAPLTAVVETVVRAKVPGAAGNNITLSFNDDGTTDGQLDESAYPAIVYHFANGVTTVANFEADIAASTYLEVKTPDGTGASTLSTTVDEFAATNLAGGTDGEGGFDLLIQTTIDGINWATHSALSETDYDDGDNITKEVAIKDANGMSKRVQQIRVTLTTLDDASKFSVTAVGVEG